MAIKNIVFDFGGVLVDWNPRYMYRDHFKDEEEMEYFLTNICTDEWNVQQDAGRSLDEGTRVLVEKFPQHSQKIQLFYDKWELMMKGAIEDNVRVLETLKDKYPIYGLTNWSAETFPIALKRFSFFGHFKGIVVSGTEKLIKPDLEFYNILLNRYKLSASECVFIDDNYKNIISANKLGFKTIHYRPDVDLHSQLIKLNLL